MARGLTMTSNMDYGSAGMTSRNLNGWMLAHSTLSSWIQFYHKPYQCDWTEATKLAVERKAKEEGKSFYVDNVLNKQINHTLYKKKNNDNHRDS